METFMDPGFIDTTLTGILIYIVWRGMDALNLSIQALRDAMERGYRNFHDISKENGEAISRNSAILEIVEKRTREPENKPQSNLNGR